VTVRLQVVRSGGFAGIERSGETDLTAEQHQAILAARSAAPRRLDPAPDRFTYELRWRFRGRRHRCELDERLLTPELRELVQGALAGPR
jgi:hypothetical protein